MPSTLGCHDSSGTGGTHRGHLGVPTHTCKPFPSSAEGGCPQCMQGSAHPHAMHWCCVARQCVGSAECSAHTCVQLCLSNPCAQLLSLSWETPWGAAGIPRRGKSSGYQPPAVALVPRGVVGCLLGMCRGVWHIICLLELLSSCSPAFLHSQRWPSVRCASKKTQCPGAQAICVGKGCSSSCSGHCRPAL